LRFQEQRMPPAEASDAHAAWDQNGTSVRETQRNAKEWKA
jgi:hypothetical protein